MSDDVDRILAEIGGPPGSGPDDWRWYCRICGARGMAGSREERDADALGHDAHVKGYTAESRRLLHVW